MFFVALGAVVGAENVTAAVPDWASPPSVSVWLPEVLLSDSVMLSCPEASATVPSVSAKILVPAGVVVV